MSPTISDQLVDVFGPAPETPVTSHAPGRVNLIGEHTDYNQGFVLPTILGCEVEVAVRRSPAARVRLHAVDLNDTLAYGPGDEPDDSWPGWAPYLVGVIEEMRGRGLLDGGLDLAVTGSVPRGSGLSSSAALETATALALARVFEAQVDPMGMVQLCQDVEHHWAGVRCGIMDQMACRLGQPGHALLIDCGDNSHRHIPLDLGDHDLVITDSGVRRELADSAYNDRRRECLEGMAQLQRQAPTIVSLRSVGSEVLDAHESGLLPHLARRCRHVVDENARVLEAAEALSHGDLVALGQLMNSSHDSLRDLFEASHPDVDHLVDTARSVPGVLGSRLTGAGWGGCTVTLCARAATTTLRRRLEEELATTGAPGQVTLPGRPRAAGIAEASP